MACVRWPSFRKPNSVPLHARPTCVCRSIRRQVSGLPPSAVCDAAQHAVQVPASSRRCGAFPAAGSGRLRPADAPSAGAGCTARPEHRRAHTRAPRVRPACAPRPQRAPRRWKPRLQRKALLSLAGAVLLVSAGQPVPGEPGPAGGGVSARLSPQAVVVVRLRTSLTCAALGLHL